MLSVVSGLTLLVASVAFELGPRILHQHLQHGLAIICIVGAICLMFRRHPNLMAKSNRLRDICIGFSVLIPVAITATLHNRFVNPFLPVDEPFDGLYSFLLWAVFLIALLPIWGKSLQYARIISHDEAQSFRTWRKITTHSN